MAEAIAVAQPGPSIVAQPYYTAEYLGEALGDPDVLSGFGPLGGKGKLIEQIIRYAGMAYVAAQMGSIIGPAAKNLLGGAGETLGLDGVFGTFMGMVGETHVAVYYRGKLLGTMELGSWKAFRSSMRRNIRDRMRVM